MAKGLKQIRRVMSSTVKYNLTVEIADEEQTSVPVSVRASDTVRDLRIKLVRKGITSWKHTFTYKGRQLGENEVFKHTGIRNGAQLVLRKDDLGAAKES
ncbi:putative ubiquitin domain-containing protein TINCR [Polyodon spathula]|uniref:putative ubiquitin domain-containing protein TINCR n=1 Tax=Polyodon spathula TaxID=7913 RepID=UPI001B7D9EEC|nr:putative ubiquitin domain-containing protein TINCR [Polyodon spathula]